MTASWLDFLGDACKLAAAGFICLVIAGWWFGRGDNFSGAPVSQQEDDPGDDLDDDAGDRHHDLSIDTGTGVTP